MKPIEHEEAIQKVCPFSKQNKCLGNGCMAWKEVNPRIKREDHSGGKDMMIQHRGKRGFQEIKREGPPGSLGVLILESQGVFELIYKER
ncbi:MAG: hypothetical protein ACOC1K_01260 [Nanoarchaeota archaeon]